MRMPQTHCLHYFRNSLKNITDSINQASIYPNSQSDWTSKEKFKPLRLRHAVDTAHLEVSCSVWHQDISILWILRGFEARPPRIKPALAHPTDAWQDLILGVWRPGLHWAFCNVPFRSDLKTSSFDPAEFSRWTKKPASLERPQIFCFTQFVGKHLPFWKEDKILDNLQNPETSGWNSTCSKEG